MAVEAAHGRAPGGVLPVAATTPPSRQGLRTSSAGQTLPTYLREVVELSAQRSRVQGGAGSSEALRAG